MALSAPRAAARRARALDYPYRPAADDYLFTGAAARPWPETLDLRHRTPVIAAGSNRAPAQLRRKFGDAATVPVSRAWLADHDVVYSAHVARYGAIPACLFPAPDTRVAVWITWLDDTQLARMHETEAVGIAYEYAHIDAALADVRERFRPLRRRPRPLTSGDTRERRCRRVLRARRPRSGSRCSTHQRGGPSSRV